MGAVYLARDPQRRSRVAIKVLAEGLEDDVDRARFEREVEALTKVGTHPGVVGLSSAGTLPDGRPYLAMDYVEGEDLEQLLKRGLSPEKIVSYVLQITSALGYAHELGLIHRDIKPGNVLIDADGERALLADFGLARFSGGAGKERLTMTGEVVGTPAYMAPEQLHPAGYGEPGPYTDVYAVGALLYFALTGRSANGEGSTIMMMANLASGERPAPLSVLLRDDPLARRLGPVVDRALSVSPADRQASASELSEDIQAALVAELPEPAPRSLVAVFVALVVVAALLALAALGIALRRTSAGTPTPTASVSGSGDLAEALRLFEAGDTRAARALLGEDPAPGAATILIASGEDAAALQAVGPTGEGLEPGAWARAARAAGNEEQRLRALSRLEPGPAALLATLQGDEPSADDESLDQDWRALVRAAQALRRGDLVSAKLDTARLAEAAGLSEELRQEATQLLLESELGLGSPSRAVKAWLQLDPRGSLDKARHAAWAQLLLNAAREAGQELSEPRLQEAADEAQARGPGLSLAVAAQTLSEGGPLPPGRARELLGLCLARGQRWLALAELGVDSAGAARSVPLLRLGRPADPARAALALSRALRLSGDLPGARVELAEASPGPARTLLEVQLQAQGLESLGLPADVARMRSSSFGQSKLTEGWAQVAAALENSSPQDLRLRIGLAAALAEQHESSGDADPRERALAILRPLAGDPTPVAKARAALAQTGVQLDGSLADVQAASEVLADACLAFLAGEAPVEVRLEALRLQALLGEQTAAEAYLALCADLPAQGWLEITTADYSEDASTRNSSVARASRIGRDRLQAAALGQGAPFRLARALLALNEQSVERFASTQASLELLAQSVVDHPDTTNSVLLLLAWTQLDAQPEAWAPKSASSWLALALRDLISERPSSESLRRAVSSCGAAIRASSAPLPSAHLIRALCLVRLGPAGELAREDLAAARAGIPWSQAPWRAELNLAPSSEAALDGLVSRGGLRLSRLALDSGGLLRFSDEARTKLLARCKEASQEGTWGPRMSAAILLQRVDDREFPLETIQKVLGGIEDPRVRRGAYALALEEMAEEHDLDPLPHRVAAQEALWSRPLGGASFGQALVLELRDRVPFPRPPLWGGLVTEAGERKLRDTRPGSGERRYWRDCDLSARLCLESLTYVREGQLFRPASLRDPDDLSRSFLSAPWDESNNTEVLDCALKEGRWLEAAQALRRLAAFDAIDRPAEAYAYQGQKRVLPAALQTRDETSRAQLYALLASVVREGLRCGREGTDRARLRGLRAEVSLFRALQSEGQARREHLQSAAADLEQGKSRHVREGRRFYAYYRRAKVAILLGETPTAHLQSARDIYRRRSEADRQTYVRSVTNDPWRPVLEKHEGFREWAERLPHLRKRRRRGRRR
jgi:protein kinase-like protein